MLISNLIQISVFLNIVFCAGLALFTYLAGNRYKSFVAFNVLVSLFFVFYSILFNTNNAETALLLSGICILVALSLSFCSLVFACEFSEVRLNKKFVICNVLVGTIFAAVVNFSSFFIKGIKGYHYLEYSPDTTSLFIFIFVSYYVGNIICTHVVLFKATQYNTKAKFVLIGYLIGFMGGSTILFPFIHISIPPIGNYSVIVYCFLMAYGITKFKVFNSSLIITKSVARVLTISTLELIYFALNSLYNFIIPFDNSFLQKNFLNIAFLLITGELYQFLIVKFQNVQQNIFNKKPYIYENLAHEINEKLSQSYESQDVVNFLQELFQSKLQLTPSMIVIDSNWIDQKDGQYYQILYLDPEISKKTSLKKYQSEFEKIKQASFYDISPNKIKELLDNNSSKCLLPFIFSGKALGFILFQGRGSNKSSFNESDHLIFDNLAFQVGSAIERIKIYKEALKQKQQNIKEEERSKIYKALAGSIAHEIRNPLNSINVISNQINDTLRNLDDEIMEIVNNADSSSDKDID